MAVVSRVATILLSDGLGSSRTLVATATVQDTPVGTGVTVTVTNTPGGTLPPGAPDTFTLQYRNESGGAIRSVTLNNTAGSQSDTFFFTDTGLSGGSARHGTVTLTLRATKTTGGPTATYDVESDGAPNTPPTLFTATQLDQGWIRSSGTATQVLSNISLGGGKNSPAQYDETLFVRTTFTAVWFVAKAMTVGVSGATPALSGTSASSTSATHDVTFTGVCDERFPAASTAVTTSLTVPTVATTGQPAAAITLTSDGMTVDPRLTCTHLLQIDNNVYATPPLSALSASDQRVFPQNGYVLTHLRAARGTQAGNDLTGGVNGLTFDVDLIASATAQNFGATNFTTANKGGEDGWQSQMLIWTAVVGGLWTKTVRITTADLDASGYLINPTVTYALVALDPNLTLIAGSTGFGDQADHFRPGVDLFFAGATLLNNTTGMTQLLDAAPTAIIMRFNFTALALEYLGTDLDWHTLGGGAADLHTLGPTPDPNVWASVFVTSGTGAAAWTTDDLFIVVTALKDGSPYSNADIQLVVGAFNRHAVADSLNDLADVDTAGVATGDVLFFDGTQWRDEPMPTAAQIADAVWDETTAEARSAGSYGDLVRDSLPVPAVDPAAIVDATWNELIGEGRTAGSFGQLLKDRIDVAVSTRATLADVQVTVTPTSDYEGVLS